MRRVVYPWIKRLEELQNKHFLLRVRWKVKNKIISLFVKSMLWRCKERNVFSFYQLSVFFKDFFLIEGDQNWSQTSISLHVGATDSAWVCGLITPLSTQLPPITAFKPHRPWKGRIWETQHFAIANKGLKIDQNTKIYWFLTISETKSFTRYKQ